MYVPKQGARVSVAHDSLDDDVICAVNCSLDDVVWDVRLHFDAQHNLDRKICSSEVTFLNLYALMHTQGYSFSDERI